MYIEKENQRPVDIYINNVKVKEKWEAFGCFMEKPISTDIRFDDISSAGKK